MGPNSAGPSYPYRLDVDLGGYPPSGHLSGGGGGSGSGGGGGPLSSSLPHPHANPHPSLTSLYSQHPNSVMSSHHHPQQNSPSFMTSPQTPFDFPRHQVPPTLRSVTFPQHSPTAHSQYAGQGHHQSQQQGMFAQQQQSQQQQHRGSGPGAPPPPVSAANNMFVELLNSSEHPGQHSQSQNFPSFDWPVHAQPQQQSRHETGKS